MTRKKKISLKKTLRFILLIVIIITALYLFFFNKDKPTTKIKEVDNISDYGYILNNNASKYYKTLFADLKKVLNEKTIDEKQYASLVGQLFVTDFYTLSNKLNSNDIGGTQFIYKSYRSTFKEQAKDPELGIYTYVENNTYGNRKQELPNVSNVEVVSIENKVHTYLKKEDEKAYYLDLKITYEKDLGYQNDVSIVLIHNDKKLEIVKIN